MSEQKNKDTFIRRTFGQIRSFLLSPKCRQFLIFLFFLFVASFFWMLQKLNDTYEMELSIPVRVEHVPDNVVLTAPPPETMRVVVRDKGTVLINYLLGRNAYPVTFNFADWDNESGKVRVESSSFTKAIASQLMGTTQITSIRPGAFDVIYTRGKAKRIPVKVNGHITPEKQYYIAETHIKPDSVLVYAPQEILDTIQEASTVDFKLENVSDTIKQQTALQPVKGAKFVPGRVELMLCPDMYTEKKVEVPIHPINFPGDKTLKTFPATVSVTFQVGLSRFKDVNADDFLITVSYDELLKCKQDTYHVKLKAAPDDAHHIRIEPADVDFLIEQTDSRIE